MRLSACVTDGVTVGHACCSVHDCKVPLASQRHHFCPDHEYLRFVCRVDSCTNAASTGFLTCTEPSHRAFEKSKELKRSAMFQLKSRLKRTGLATRGEPATSALQALEDPLAEPLESASSPTLTTPSSIKLKARFSRRWTHNEQLVVRCCGIIISRATFFGSEAINGVGVSEPPAP